MKQFPYGVQSPADTPEVAKAILSEYFAITAGLGIRACVIYGVCLGFYRDGEFPAGDNDIDVVAVVDDDLDRAFVTKRLVAHGFLMGRTYAPQNTHFVKDGILIDVYWRKPEGFYSEFAGVDYHGTAFPIPARIEEFLVACYGDDWRTPQDKGSVYIG